MEIQLDSGGRPNGKVDFRLTSLHEVAILKNTVHDDIIQVNGIMMPIQVNSEALLASDLHRS